MFIYACDQCSEEAGPCVLLTKGPEDPAPSFCPLSEKESSAKWLKVITPKQKQDIVLVTNDGLSAPHLLDAIDKAMP